MERCGRWQGEKRMDKGDKVRAMPARRSGTGTMACPNTGQEMTYRNKHREKVGGGPIWSSPVFFCDNP